MRGKKAQKRLAIADTKYGNLNIGKFVTFLMKDGKRSVAEHVIYGALEEVAKKSGKNEIEIFEEVLKNLMPQVEVKSKRVGGANYQVPSPVRGERSRALALRWLIGAAHSRKGGNMTARLSAEILDAVAGNGDAMKKKADVHRMAEANRAFAHFAKH